MSEDLVFNPNQKLPMPKGDIQKNLDKDLDSIIKDRKKERAKSKKEERKHVKNNQNNKRDFKNSRTNERFHKKTNFVEKSTRKIQKDGPIEIKVDKKIIREILDQAHVEYDGYSVRLVAIPKSK